MQGLHYVLQYELFNELNYADKLEFCTAQQNPGLYEEYVKNLFDIIRSDVDIIKFYWDEPPDGPTYSDPFDEDSSPCLRSFVLFGKRLIDSLKVDEYGRNFLMRLIISQKHKISRAIIINYISSSGYGCRPEVVDKTDMNALCWACRYGMDDVAVKLLDMFGSKCWNDNHILRSKAYIFARDSDMMVAERLLG